VDHHHWFVAGVIAKFLMLRQRASGFILTTIPGSRRVRRVTRKRSMVWPRRGAGLIGAVVGAIIVLFAQPRRGRRSAVHRGRR
jgi:uncharacterized membrane protein YeaQ/YmgE (transglycosylase-associated protein family)